MKLEVLEDAEAVARRAAAVIAEAAREAVRVRGRFVLATSGGSTPWRMLELLAAEAVPWAQVHVFQVDERVVGPLDDARNLFHLRRTLQSKVALPASQLAPMPVDDADLPAAVARYASMLWQAAGVPVVLDLVHLGLGTDGHTASLVPGDPALESTADVALTGAYQGHRRMTMCLPVLNRARQVLWVVTGAEKAPALARLMAQDVGVPAGLVAQAQATVLADRAAAAAIAPVG